MATFLSDLLGAIEPLFSMSINQLEKASGQTGADVRLIADIIKKTHGKMKQLGLDPNDTTGTELYQSLQSRIQMHDTHLAKAIGGEFPSHIEHMLPYIVKSAQNFKMPRNAWVLKKSVAKRLLRDLPPPGTMKFMGHSSVESMLKREHVSEIYSALRFVESSTWQAKFVKSYKELTPSDFETRDIEIIQLSKERWGDVTEAYVRNNRHNISHLKELGVVSVLPMQHEHCPGITILALPLILHYINEIRLYSSYFKHQQVKPHFGATVAATIVGDADKAALLAGTHIHWRVIQRFYGKQLISQHPEVFEPHVQPEDLAWQKTEEYMCAIDPKLTFWQGMDYVAVMDGKKPVSFNLLDNAISYCTGATYEQRSSVHAQNSLWNEVFIRYMGEANLAQTVLKQLDTNMIAPERLKV